MVASLATPQDAMDALDTSPVLAVYVGGVLTDVETYSGDHRVGRTAVGSLSLPLPVPGHVTPGALVEVQAGHNDLVGTVFAGMIPRQEAALSMRGATLDVALHGWSAVLAEPELEDMVFDGPVTLDAVFVAVCERKGIPAYIADRPVYPDGVTAVTLGGNLQVNEGKVTIKADQSPLAQLQRMAADYATYIFDIPQGPVVLKQVSGLPNTAPVIALQEGVHLVSISHDHDIRDVVNYHDVQGVVYEDQFGGLVPVRSRPESYEPDPLIAGGVRRRPMRSSDIVRQDQADAIRQFLEINASDPSRPVACAGVGVPGIAPGDVVQVESTTVGTTGSYWLMGLRQAFSVRSGFAATYDLRAGTGQAMPSLIERTEIVIDDAVWHGGDEYVAWYANPAPQGQRKTWPFSLPQKATHVNIRAFAHSWNSQLQGGANTDLNTSKWEIWPSGADRDADGARPETSGTLPVMNEDYALQPDFDEFVVDDDGNVVDPGHWSQTAVSLSRLDPGDWELDLVCGKGAGIDDGEVRRIRMEVWAASDPAEVLPE